MGSAYQDGFTIALSYDRSKLPLPLKIDLTLTNDPKRMAGENEEMGKRLLEGSMTAEIAGDLTIKFSNFKMLATKDALAARNE